MKRLAVLAFLCCACSDDGEAGPKGRFTVETVASGLDLVDAALSPDGETVYYLTRGPDAGLFEVSAGGTRKIESFSNAQTIAVSNDGRTVFVVDDTGIVTLRPDGSLGKTNVPGTSGVTFEHLFVGDKICGGNGNKVDCYPLAGGPVETVTKSYPSAVHAVAIAVGNDTFATTDSGVLQAHFDEFPEPINSVVGESIVLSVDEDEVLVASGSAITIFARDGGATSEVFDDVIGGGGDTQCLQRAPQADVFVYCGKDAVYRLRER